MERYEITIAIPVFNETKSLADLIKKTVDLPLKKEIIIIDDGSSEETKTILQTINKEYPRIKLITNRINIGKTASVQKALQLANGTFFVILDGDSELDPCDIEMLYLKIVKSNIRFVNGTRHAFSHLVSRMGKTVVSSCIGLLYGKKIQDPLSGLKLFYTNDFKNYTFSSRRFGLETELIIEALKRKYLIEEIDIHYYPRTYKEGKKIRLLDGFNILYLVIQKNILSVIFIALFVWLISFSVYSLPSTASPTSDTIPNTFTAVNILYNKRLDLDNFKTYFLKRQIISFVATENNQGKLYAKTPIINGIITAPFIYVIDHLNRMGEVTADDFLQRDLESYYQFIGKQFGSILASISVVFVFFTLYLLFQKKSLAFFWTVAYALGTSVYSTAAQGNWQHAPSLLLITAAYYCLFLFFKKNRIGVLILLSILLSLATLIRISNILFFLSIGFIFLLYSQYRKYLTYLFLFFLFPLISWSIFLQIARIPGGYNEEIVRSIQALNLPHTIQVAISLLMSPNVGLLVFSPICLFGIVGIARLVYDRTEHVYRRFLMASAISFLGIFLFNSIWWAWEGGYSWGPRLLTEGMPFLIFLGAYLYQSLQKNVLRKITRLAFIMLFIASFFIQLIGVYAYETEWQAKYFKRNGTYVSAWYNNPSILEFYLKRGQFHTIQLIKKDDHIYLEKNYYQIHSNLYKPFLPIQKIRYTIKKDDMDQRI